MEEIRQMVEEESKKLSATTQLSFRNSYNLFRYGKAQENLKNYALKNSAMAQENFLSA